MIILSRIVSEKDGKENVMSRIASAYLDSCDLVKDTMESIIQDEIPESYEDWVAIVLDMCLDKIPTPFCLGGFASQYNLSLGADYFSLRIPYKFAFGMKIIIGDDGNNSYKLSIVFYGDNNAFIKNTNEYKDMIDKGWEYFEPYYSENYKSSKNKKK